MGTLLQKRARRLDRTGDRRRDLEPLAAERDLSAGDARDVQKILDQSREMLRLTPDDVPLPSRVLVAPHVHEVERGEDGIQGIPELVAQHREEFVLAAVGVAQVGLLFAQRLVELLSLRDLGLERAGAPLQLRDLAAPRFGVRLLVVRLRGEHVRVELADLLERIPVLGAVEMAETVPAIELEGV